MFPLVCNQQNKAEVGSQSLKRKGPLASKKCKNPLESPEEFMRVVGGEEKGRFGIVV